MGGEINRLEPQYKLELEEIQRNEKEIEDMRLKEEKKNERIAKKLEKEQKKLVVEVEGEPEEKNTEGGKAGDKKEVLKPIVKGTRVIRTAAERRSTRTEGSLVNLVKMALKMKKE